MQQEKEIVLGNKQLISFFFVVLALCGVFFALGYMIRGNGLKQQSAASGALPDMASAASPSPMPANQESEPPRETIDTSTPAAAPPTATTTPAQVETSKQAGTPPPAPVAAAPLETGVSYLQIAALKRSDAENLVKTLREQNFPGVIEQSSVPSLFRVLIGPYRQVADLADAKVKLKALGFADAKVEKR